ncbi:MAG: hypothetical protein ACOYI2_05750 [Bacillota bacterium]|jgi:hypothetical protein|nr:flagellar protein FlgN [Clostridia bacterium]
MKDHEIKLFSLLQELLSLAEEQRSAIKTRNLEKFEEITADLSGKCDQLLNLEKAYAQSPRAQEQKRELWALAEKLRETNQSNLILIQSSADFLRSVLNNLMSGSLRYEGTGSIVRQGKQSALLDKTL